MLSSWVLVFLFTFFFMEFAAWFLHKYFMHGFLWVLHKDHHVINKDRWWQLNDAFAIFFAVPSFLSILFDAIYSMPVLGAFGYGIMFYGLAYFFIHEVVIHKRINLKVFDDNWYVQGVKRAHHIHHSVREKEGAENFGMLIVSLKYFKRKKTKIR